ncbi:MAG: leucine-rich repeat protein [Lachnospiraceae bacterium]|nr:leucine-rich repeat protein [Lachnospiraceae bacterium]
MKVMNKLCLKHILFGLLCVYTLVLCVPGRVEAAAGGTCGDNLTWKLDDGGILTISGTGEMYDYNFDASPWTLMETTGNTGTRVKTVIVESGVTYIGKLAFDSCKELKDVTIPNTVTHIGDNAFAHSGLKNIIIEEGLTHIGDCSFWDCYNLEGITIPESVIDIDDGAFSLCKFTEIRIPKNVKTIGVDALFCEKLTSIIVDPENEFFSSEEGGYLYDKNKETLLRCPNDIGGSFSIPNTVKTIGNEVFAYRTGLSNVVFPESITSIGNSAFKGCTGLRNVVLPKNLANIGSNAFQYCSDICITIPASLSVVGWHAFQCKNLSVIISEGTTGICDNSFADCSGLKSILIPNTVKSVGTGAFYGCSGLTDVKLPAKLESIGMSAFANCTGLKNLAIPDSVTIIDKSVFSGCVGLTKISIPDNVKTIGDCAFAGCGLLSEITVSGVESIGQLAFENCTSIEDISISKVTTIGDGAFRGCTSLKRIIIPEGVTVLGDGKLSSGKYSVFSGCTGLESVLLPDALKAIDANSFYGCCSLKEISIPNGVAYIGEGSFNQCSSLRSITLPIGTNSIGKDAFSGCGELTYISLPGSVIYIGNDAFSLCEKLTDITLTNSLSKQAWKGVLSANDKEKVLTISDGITAIPKETFKGCDNVKSVILPESLTTIRENAFEGCSALTEITLPKNVQYIDPGAFSDWNSNGSLVLEEGNNYYSITDGVLYDKDIEELIWCPGSRTGLYRIPETVTNVYSKAFKGCSGLTSIVIPFSVTSIGSDAFYGCDSITDIYYFGSEDSWNAIEGISDGALNGISPTVHYVGGYCGDKDDNDGKKLYWTLELDGTLAVTGTGDMDDFAKDGPWPAALVKKVVIGSGITSIGANAFIGCAQMSTIELPDSITKLGSGALKGCAGLTRISIPESVTVIGANAFEGCNGLAEIGLSKNVTSIGTDAFLSCEKLERITVDLDNNSYKSSEGALLDKNAEQLICCPAGFEGSFTIPDTVISIYDRAFLNCKGMTEVIIPSITTSIGAEAFKGCTGLSYITIPFSVSAIGDSGFYGCDNLSDIYYYGSESSWNAITGISGDALNGANPTIHYYGGYCGKPTVNGGKNLYWTLDRIGTLTITGSGDMEDYSEHGPWEASSVKNVVMGSDVTGVGSNAFVGCNELTEITIPKKVTSVGAGAFSCCDKLTSIIVDPDNTAYKVSEGSLYYKDVKKVVCCLSSFEGTFTVPDTVESLLTGAFKGCDKLTGIVLPGTLTGIGADTFKGCTGLTYITIPFSVTSIGTGAFNGCENLADIYYYGSESSWNAIEGISGGALDGASPTIHYMGGYCGKKTINDGKNLYWTLDINGTLTVTGTGDMESYAEHGPWDSSLVKKAVIGSNITSIGASAFSGCSQMTDIEMPGSIAKIESNALKGCTGLPSISIPAGVTEIGASAFEGCTGISAISIPKNVGSIGAGAFSNCEKLTSISVDSDNTTYTVREGVLVDNSVEQIICFPAGLEGSYTIPDTIKTLLGSAFKGCKGLTSITVPVGVTSLGTGTFSGCSGLTDIYYDGYIGQWDRITGIDDAALTEINPSIHYKYAGGYCGAPEINGGKNVYWGLDLEGTLTITGNGVMADFSGHGPWDSSKVKKAVIESGVTSIGNEAFLGCTNLTDIFIPESVTSIGKEAFYGCSRLAGVSLPSSITNISDYMFYNCTGLIDITLPEKVTEIGKRAFFKCSSLETITIKGELTGIGTEAFSGCSKLATIVLYAGQNHVWKQILEACPSVKNVTIAGGVTSLWDNAFKDCEGIECIVLPSGLTTVGSNAFSGCNVSTVTLPNASKVIWDAILDGCSNLTSVVIPAGITEIPEEAFKGRCNLTRISIPDSVTVIGGDAFNGCSGLESIAIPDGVEIIQNNTFEGCTGLTSIDIPESVTRIAGEAFKGCSNLEEISIPTSVSIIEEGVFSGCEALNTIDYAGTPDQWEAISGIGDLDTCGAQIYDSLSVKVESIKLDTTEATIKPGEKLGLKEKISPSDATYTDVIWSSSNEEVATVSQSGEVLGIMDGEATITVKTVNSKTAKCEITVDSTIYVTGIRLNTSKGSLKGKETLQLIATVNPSDATDKTVTWTSSNINVATVNQEGLVTGVGNGTATITAKSKNGKTATCEVTVDTTVYVTSVSLNTGSATLEAGKSIKLVPTVAPSNAHNKNVTWTSSNTGVATVDSQGNVKGIKAGTSVITVKTVDGGKTATCKITVNATTSKDVKATGVKLDKTKATVYTGKTVTLKPTVSPTNATNKTVTWKSNNTKIATVSSNGVVTGKKKGTVTITVTTANGKTATCKVTVKQSVVAKSVKLNKTTVSIKVGKTVTLKATINPSKVTDKTLKWTSGNTKVATVSSKGVVKGKKKGKATITVKTSNGKTAKCKVTVK